MQNNTDIFIIADDSPVGKQGYRPKSMCYFLVGHRLQKWNIFLVFQVCICNAIYLSKDICLVIRVHRLAMSMESFLFCQTLIFPLLWAAGSWERGWKASKSEVCIISVVSPLTWFVSVFYIWAWVKQTKENVITVGVGDNRRQTCITPYVLWVNCDKCTEKCKPGIFTYLIYEAHANTSDPIIKVMWSLADVGFYGHVNRPIVDWLVAVCFLWDLKTASPVKTLQTFVI